MADITSANSTLFIGVNGLFPVPQQLQGFASDDAYSMDAVDNKEVLVGVDAKLSAGWIPQIKTMKVMLQADSVSAQFFEDWYNAEEAARGAFTAFGTISQPSVGKVYTLTKGFIRGFTPFADAGKVLKPRSFTIAWESVIGAPI